MTPAAAFLRAVWVPALSVAVPVAAWCAQFGLL